MAARLEQLQAFLVERSARPFTWGTDDCSLFLADWWRFVHGVDPAARVRGTYETEAECHTMLEREGGLLRLASRLANGAGMLSADGSHVGDFGIIGAGGTMIGGICTGSHWAIRNEGGIGMIPPPRILKAWRV